MYQDLKLKLLNGAFALAGNFISGQIKGESEDKHSQNLDNYYSKLSSLVEKKQKQPTPVVEQKIEPESKPTIPTPTIDLTPAKIESGVSCIPCSNEHLGVAAALLKEAAKFATRENGMRDKEVIDRVHDAILELDALERWDLKPENIDSLAGKEKELAKWALNQSADVRHAVTAAKSPDELIHASTLASSASKTIMRAVWNMSLNDGTVDKLCINLSGKEKVKCIETINKVLQKEM